LAFARGCYSIGILGATLAIGLLLILGIIPQTKQQTNTCEHREAGERCPTPLDPPFAVFAVLPIQVSPGPRQGGSDNDSGNWQEWFWPPIWSNWALGIIAVVAICVGLRTLRAIQREAIIMIRQSRVLQRQANTMERQANISRDAAQQQLRAYIGVHQVGFMGIEDDTPFGVGFAFINHGQTPASKFNLKGVVDLLPYPLPDGLVLPEPPDRATQDGVIFPNETNSMTGWVWERETQRLNAKEKVGLLAKDTTKEFYAHGIATYNDIFGITRSTEFCFVLNPASVIRDKVGDILRDKGAIKFQWAPVANHNATR